MNPNSGEYEKKIVNYEYITIFSVQGGLGAEVVTRDDQQNSQALKLAPVYENGGADQNQRQEDGRDEEFLYGAQGPVKYVLRAQRFG